MSQSRSSRSLVAAVPVRGRGLDEWVPVAAGFWLRPRRGALCAGATAVPGEEGWRRTSGGPTATTTALVELRHLGLRALDDEPRALGEALAVVASRASATSLDAHGP